MKKSPTNFILLIILSLWNLAALAQPDFGDPTSPRLYLRRGIADHLSAENKARFIDVKASMNKHRFREFRKTVVDVLDFTAAHPGSVCSDKGLNSNVNSAKELKGKIGLTCTYTAGGKKSKKTFNGLMTTDLDKVLDSNMKTPMEAYEDRQAALDRQRRQGPHRSFIDHEPEDAVDESEAGGSDQALQARQDWRECRKTKSAQVCKRERREAAQKDKKQDADQSIATTAPSPYSQYINTNLTSRDSSYDVNRSVGFSKENTSVQSPQRSPAFAETESGVQYSKSSDQP